MVIERRGAILTLAVALFLGVTTHCNMKLKRKKVVAGEPPSGATPMSDSSLAAERIRQDTLRLCTAIADLCPKGRRLDAALGSIRAGVRLALEELAERRTLLATPFHEGGPRSDAAQRRAPKLPV